MPSRVGVPGLPLTHWYNPPKYGEPRNASSRRPAKFRCRFPTRGRRYGSGGRMPRTALVVEDEPELGELFADILRLRGIDATVLHLGRPAPEWIRQHRPDLILLDLMLPD